MVRWFPLTRLEEDREEERVDIAVSDVTSADDGHQCCDSTFF